MRSQHVQPPGGVTYGDSFSIGQLAQMWERDPFFVRQMISEGKLIQDEGGLVTNTALREFYREHGHLLNV